MPTPRVFVPLLVATQFVGRLVSPIPSDFDTSECPVVDRKAVGGRSDDALARRLSRRSLGGIWTDVADPGTDVARRQCCRSPKSGYKLPSVHSVFPIRVAVVESVGLDVGVADWVGGVHWATARERLPFGATHTMRVDVGVGTS
jgi:hypothetical protein